MSENTQQGYTATDLTGIAATIAGIVAVILVATLPYREVGFALAAIAAALILAVTSATFARKEHRHVSWFARIGSAGGIIAIVMMIIWEIARNQ